ncbi:MAG: hybrid sensor histidine kinase/response regulator, partial [Gemmatimonadota bacterium]
LVARWCDRAIEEQPTAQRVHYETLRNRLRPFLEAMGRGLSQAGDGDPLRHRTHALEHGEQRWDKGWSIAELVRDYQILQLVILEHLEAELERPLRYREVMAVGVFVDDAVAASVAAYVANNDLEIRELEKERAQALREADRRKDDFLASLGHELRNPLAPILNSARALALMLPNAEPAITDSIRVIRRQARQLARLLDDLADLTRIAQGHLELRRGVVDIADVFEHAVQTTRPLMERRGHRLTILRSEERLMVEGDAARLQQIVVNLLNNAARYTPQGGEILLVSERRGADVVIRVKDNGVGIPADMTARIFDLYARSEMARVHSPEGLGIGLALVKELVALHGGIVECHSAGLGAGAEFVVRMPAFQGPRGADSTTPATPVRVGTQRLLLVEDDVDSRESLTILLRLMGHDVENARDGTSGLLLALNRDFDAAIIDIGLPDRSGYEVAQRIRQERGDQMKLIALTGFARTDDMQRAVDAGFDAHLVKPLDIDALGRILAPVPK